MNSKNSFSTWKKIVCAFLCIFSLNAVAEKAIYLASFADFDRRAHSAVKPVSVVFFGGSLTWGDGTSDPERASYRALMENYLREKYPVAHFDFHDAAVGGAGSKLGMFRVTTDVLSHKPDLVFLEFTIEDKLDGTDRQTLASYERILRDLISEGIPVVEVLLGTKEYFGEDWKHLGPTRFRDHLELGNLYHTGIGNSFPVVQNFFRNGTRDRNQIWPKAESKANDAGHRLFFESVRAGFDEAVREHRLCNLPRDTVFADEYKMRVQIYPATGMLPSGWRVAKTLRPALEPTEIGNEWVSQVAISGAQDQPNVSPLQLGFNGTFVGILGEADKNGLGFKVFIDGELIPFQTSPKEDVWPTSTSRFGGGERFFWHEISDQLEPGHHTLKIQPVVGVGVDKGELRIESICIAGPSGTTPQIASSEALPF